MTIHDPRYSDVIIIGGGATGAGIARDCALRGLSVTLLERHDIATGATPGAIMACCTVVPVTR